MPPSAFVFELDHLLVWADVGGPEADRLVQFGLSEGDANRHSGQGTACRRFFFRNAYLELPWVHDAEEAQKKPVDATQLWLRWSGRHSVASPFGLCLRPAGPGGSIPFPTWEYQPPYLPPPLVIHVAQDVPLSEPFWFYLGFGRRPDDAGWPKPQPLQHAAGFWEVTGVRFCGPGLGRPSTVARTVTGMGFVALAEAPDHCAEVTFDGGRRRQSEDFRPTLPLVFHW